MLKRKPRKKSEREIELELLIKKTEDESLTWKYSPGSIQGSEMYETYYNSLQFIVFGNIEGLMVFDNKKQLQHITLYDISRQERKLLKRLIEIIRIQLSPTNTFVSAARHITKILSND